MTGSHMERFWDARAREDAFWFVDSRLEYGSPDEEAFWMGGEEALDRLLEAVGAAIEPASVVVDIGCGLGRLTRPLARRAEHVYALDVSGEMLGRARALNLHLENVTWLHGSGSSLEPIGSGTVDTCVSHVVFRHIPDPEITLGYVREMGRVLRLGGMAAFEFSNRPETHKPPALRPRDRVAAALGRAPRGVTDDAWVGSSVEMVDLERVAAESGLTIAQVDGAGSEYCAVSLSRTKSGGGGSPPL